MLTGMRVLPRAASPLIAASRVSVRLLLSRVPLNWKNAPPVLHWETVAPVASRVERSPYRSAREREMRILVLLSCRVESTAGTAQARPAQADAAVSSQRSADLPPCASLPSPSPALQALRCPPLPSLGHIYAQADAGLLTTWAQMDHFGARADAPYSGVQPPPRQAMPVWPAGPGPKVLGYLGLMPGLESLLQALQAAGVCALLFVRGMPDVLRQHYSSPQMQFIDRPVDLHAAASQVDWVLNNSNHGSVVHFALHGVPQLLIPLHQEQLFLALRMLQHGGAAMAYQDQPAYGAAVATMQSHAVLRQNARSLAAAMTPIATLDAPGRIAQTLAQLLP